MAFLNFDKCRLEVAGPVVSGLAIDETGMDSSVKFGDSRSNRLRGIRAAHIMMDGDAGRRR